MRRGGGARRPRSRRRSRRSTPGGRRAWRRLIAGRPEAGQRSRRSIESLGPMKTTFRPRLLNGQTGDAALLVTLRWQGRALLIDLGRIDRTPGGMLLPIEAVFV